MNANEFEKKLKSLPEQDPDEMELAMLAQAKAENDGSTVSLESYKKELDEYSGKLVLRIPRSLHKQLKEAAQMEGVSLNQYMLYKLAK